MPRKPQPLEQRVLEFVRRHCLVTKGETLVVAVSGGADSLCLFHVLHQLRKELNFKLHIAHLNHRLRAAESEADADFVTGLSRRLRVPATIESRDIRAYQTQYRLTLEEAAREVRYAFLSQVAGNTGAGSVATGHTQDDHLETILMHIIRGTGIKGLCGLQPVTNLNICGKNLTVIRPLLTLTRQETAAYCRRHCLSPRLDTTNLELRPLRNRIRLELIPTLKEYNTGISDALLRLSRNATEDVAFIDEEVARQWSDIAIKGKDSVILNKEKMLSLGPSLKRHLLRRCFEELLGTLKDIEERHIDEIISALEKPAGKKLSLPGGLTFVVEYQRYLLGSDLSAASPLPELKGVFPLTIPGETLLPGWRVMATVLDREASAQGIPDMDEISAWFDLDKTGNTIEVRTANPGDRFQPLGMSNLKKVSEFMLDARIPRELRKRIPIVSSPQQILWVAGWRIDDRVKVTEKTRRVLCLRMKKAVEQP